MSGEKIQGTLDITADRCPMTFVKVKLTLEDMNQGDILEVIVSEGEPLENVPGNLKREGHSVLSIEPVGQYYRMLVQKG
ncbi:MAG: sulfurtransferase TusA family protein [Thermincolia bacterium]